MSAIKMEHETAHYILTYFSSILTVHEQQALYATHSKVKLGLRHNTITDSALTNIYRHIGWLSEEENVQDLLKDGYDLFEVKAATRILNDYGEKIFLNTCPNCNKLARTPHARQCRHCGHSWRKNPQ